jgi:hypothetical protein
MLYEKCSEVSPEYWQELKQANMEDICRRTGAFLRDGMVYLPFLNRELRLDLVHGQVEAPAPDAPEPDFLTCMTAVLYLLRVDPSTLGAQVSPMELTGASTFFQARGPHALPTLPLESTFGSDLPAFLETGRRLGGQKLQAGDAALALEVFPGLTVGVILWEADEEFPSKASFTVPANLERCWHLDAVLALLQLVVRELKEAARQAGA